MKFNFALMCQDEIKSLTVQIEQLRNEPTITVNPYFESNKQIRIDSLMKSRQIWERVLEIYRISEEPSTMLFHNWIVFTNDEKYFTVAKITNHVNGTPVYSSIASGLSLGEAVLFATNRRNEEIGG